MKPETIVTPLRLPPCRLVDGVVYDEACSVPEGREIWPLAWAYMNWHYSQLERIG